MERKIAVRGNGGTGMGQYDFFSGSRRRGAIEIACALLLLVVSGGCSGGGNNGGGSGGNSNALFVAINPTSALVQLNQSIQFNSAVVNAPTLSIVASTGAVRASNVVTITTTAAHGFAPGTPVTVNGVADTSFIGTFLIVSVPSPTTLTYNQTGADATSGGGTIPHTAVRWQVNGVEGGNMATGTITATGLYTAPQALPAVTTATIAANGAVRASSVVTITTTAAHTFVVGQVISILNVPDPAAATASITGGGAVRSSNTITFTTSAAHGFSPGQIVTVTGVTDSSFNGVFPITSVPSATSFVVFQTGTAATSGGGTASVPGTSFNGTFAIATAPSSTTFTYNQLGTNSTSGNGTVNSSAVRITAVSVADSTQSATASLGLDSGIILSISPTAATVGTGETLQFTGTTSGVTTTTVNWFVNTTPGGDINTIGSVDSTGLYTAPATVPSTAVVTVRAQAAADPTKVAMATVTISDATMAVPTLTSVWPTLVAEGSVFQDFYLEGTNFLTTTEVRFNGVLVPVTPTAITSTLIRARVPAAELATAGIAPITIAQQGGANQTLPRNVTVIPQRPALVGPSPDSAIFGSGTVTLDLHGGYFSNSITADFDNGTPLAPVPSASDPSRQIQIGINSTPPTGPGLIPVTVRNPGATPPLVAANLAIQPDVVANPPTTTNVAVGAMPSAVAVNSATGIAVVANRGDGTISLIDLATNAVTNTVAVGISPTGVAVDDTRNVAVVANNGSDSFSVVNLATGVALPPIPSPNAAGTMNPLKPFAVAVNSLTGLAIVANQSSNEATVINLANNSVFGTVTVATGVAPSVAVEPRLNWAMIAPGGTGTLAIVDLGDPSSVPARLPRVVATVLLGSGLRGVSINPETRRALLADPASPFMLTLSLLDQLPVNVTENSMPMELGHVATASNPLTDLAVAANPTTDRISLINMGAANRVLSLNIPNTCGAGCPNGPDPVAIAIDPGTNKAVVANQAAGDVTIVSLGAIRPVHVLQVNPAQPIVPNPPVDLNVTVTGFGFTGASVVRVDETPLATALVSSRRLTATIPAAMLGGARRFALDVIDGGNRSNVVDLGIIQSISVGSAPVAVALDIERNLALVTNSGSNDVSVVDLNTSTTTTVAVGTNPQGVAVYSRGGRAAVSNRDSNSVSILDLTAMTPTATNVAVGIEPIGVAYNQDNGEVLVANSGSNTISFIIGSAVDRTASVSPNVRPVAIAVDPVRGLAAVASSGSNSLAVLGTGASPQLQFSISNVQGANGVIFDPVTNRFVAVASLGNTISVIDPVTRQAVTARVGINPTSIDYNRNSSTLVTINTASRSVSVMDFIDRSIRAILPLTLNSGQDISQGGVLIHPRTNVAIFVDKVNNRILLIQLPR